MAFLKELLKHFYFRESKGQRSKFSKGLSQQIVIQSRDPGNNQNGEKETG